MKSAILLILSILLFTSNPCYFLSCWFCNPKGEDIYDAECYLESAQVPLGRNEITALPRGLSKQECPTTDDLCSSTTVIMSHEGKLRNVTTRGCGTWNNELGMLGFSGSRASGVPDCKKRVIGSKIIIEVEVCFCYTDLCNGNTDITHVEKQQMKANDSTKLLSKLEKLEREAETLEKGVNKIQETIHELRDEA